MKSTLQLNTMETTYDLRGLRRERIRERRIRKASLVTGIVLPVNTAAKANTKQQQNTLTSIAYNSA